MKVNKTICLDVELVNRLVDEDNMSQLICDLLKEHYAYIPKEKLSDEDRLAYLKNELARNKLKEKHKLEMEKFNGK